MLLHLSQQKVVCFLKCKSAPQIHYVLFREKTSRFVYVLCLFLYIRIFRLFHGWKNAYSTTCNSFPFLSAFNNHINVLHITAIMSTVLPSKSITIIFLSITYQPQNMEETWLYNLHCPDLIPYQQGQVSQYLVSGFLSEFYTGRHGGCYAGGLSKLCHM